MNSKVFFVLAALGAVMLASQTVSAEEVQPGKPHVLEFKAALPGEDPDSPLLAMSTARNLCTSSCCNSACRCVGFRTGSCNANRVCVCAD